MSAFRIDVYSVGNVKTNGMTTSVSQVRYSIKASKVGALSFVVPTLEYINSGMGSRKWYYLYHRRFGLIGRFRHLSEDFDENAETVTVTCEDALSALIDVSLDFNMSSVSGTVLAELNRVLGRAGWSATLANTANEFFDVALDYQGINIMQALDTLRQMQRGFFVLSGINSVRFGRWTDALRDSSAYTLITNASTNGTGPAITSLVVVGTSAQIVNRMIPRGQGIGTTQVDLSKSTRTSPYAIASRANWDGGNTDGATPSAALTRTYYIEDAGSIAANGVVERVAVFSDIRPITNSLADQRNAANALYDVAAAYMQQYKNPTTEYRVSVAGTPALLKAGDVIMIDYRGVSGTATGRKSRVFLDKKRFFVVEANHDFEDMTGEPTTTLTLAENGAKLADVTDVFTNLLADLDKFKLRPAPSIGPLEDNGPTKPIKNGVAWRHKFKIGTDVLDVNECKFVFDVTPLIVTATTTTSAPSSTQASSSGGEFTQTSSSGGGGTTTSAPTQTGYSGETLTSNPYILDVISPNMGNTGGVAGTSGVYGSFTEFQQHWHTAGDHQHPIDTHWHEIYLIPHTHTVTISAHTHTVSVPAHTHTITIPAHNHDIIFGVVEDTNIPIGVSVWFNNTQITPIKNHENGQFAGNTISAVGTYYVDLIPALQAIQGGMQGNHVIEVRCTSGQGMIYGKAKGRVTIQPIRVVD